jgi:5'-deoxynucleotidase YfbR-like HD superfamily hydrolase
MQEKLDTGGVDALEKLAEVALAFGKVNRLTRHKDGKTLESDTDHTVMLGLVACAYASRFAPHLELGKIAQFALVHDFVEVYAGDMAHVAGNLTIEQKQIKKEKEHKALLQLKKEFGGKLPWLTKTIEEYESLVSPEGRFIKTMDKVMAKITHNLNKNAVLKEMGYDAATMTALLKKQEEEIANTYGKDQPEAMSLLKIFNERTLKKLT